MSHYAGKVLVDRERRIRRIAELEKEIERRATTAKGIADRVRDLEKENAELRRQLELAKSDDLIAGAGYHHQLPSRPSSMIGCPVCTYECTCEMRR